MGRTYSCWMLNCWCITWPLGVKRLIRYVTLRHELFFPSVDLCVCLQVITIGTTDIEDLRLLQCHAFSIDEDVSEQHSASIFILAKYLVLFFDCLTSKMEVLRFLLGVRSYLPVHRAWHYTKDVYRRKNTSEINSYLTNSLVAFNL
jgi:hypothetical protein